MILTCGDTHGDFDYRKLNNHTIVSRFGTLPNYLIIAGDFGVPWSNDPSNAQDLYMKKWYESKPYDVVVVLGNHENYARILQMPLEEYHGAKVRRYGKNIVFVERGEVLTIEGKTILTLGGAESIDKAWRRPGVSWWPEEAATYADFLHVQDILSKLEKPVDYIITHTAPEEVIATHGLSEKSDSVSKLLTWVDGHSNCVGAPWYHGHLHIDGTIYLEKTNRTYVSMYHVVQELQ